MYLQAICESQHERGEQAEEPVIASCKDATDAEWRGASRQVKAPLAVASAWVWMAEVPIPWSLPSAEARHPKGRAVHTQRAEFLL